MKLIWYVASLCFCFQSGNIAAENQIKPAEIFDAIWKQDRDGGIVVIVKNLSSNDLLIVVPSDISFDGTMTYSNAEDSDKNYTVTTALGLKNREIMIPLLGLGKDRLTRDQNAVVGKMEFLNKKSKIREISLRFSYCFLSDIQNVDSFSKLKNVLRTWEGNAKEDQKMKIIIKEGSPFEEVPLAEPGPGGI